MIKSGNFLCEAHTSNSMAYGGLIDHNDKDIGCENNNFSIYSIVRFSEIHHSHIGLYIILFTVLYDLFHEHQVTSYIFTYNEPLLFCPYDVVQHRF